MDRILITKQGNQIYTKYIKPNIEGQLINFFFFRKNLICCKFPPYNKEKQMYQIQQSNISFQK